MTRTQGGTAPSGQSDRKGEVNSYLAEVQMALPKKLNEQLRLDQARLEGKVLRYSATSLVPLDASGAQRAAHERAIRQLYCEQSSRCPIGLIFILADLVVSD